MSYLSGTGDAGARSFVTFMILAVGFVYGQISPLCQQYGLKAPHSLCLADSSNFVRNERTNPSEIQKIHNDFRVQMPSIPKLVDLRWDNDLAEMAQRWAAQCPTGHDVAEDRSYPTDGGKARAGTEPLWWVGQNQCFSRNFDVSWADCVNAWAEERFYWRYGTGSLNGSDVGHFTQMIWQTTTSIGCAKVSCQNSEWDFVLVCNYFPGGNIGLVGTNSYATPFIFDPSVTNTSPFTRGQPAPVTSAKPTPPLTTTPIVLPPSVATVPSNVDTLPPTTFTSPPPAPVTTDTAAPPLPPSTTSQSPSPPAATNLPDGGSSKCKEYNVSENNPLCLKYSPSFLSMESSPEKEIVDYHNTIRGEVSPISKIPLPDMKWDVDLAEMSEKVAALCSGGQHYVKGLTLPDRKANGPAFSYIGQSLCAATADMPWVKCLDEWAKEKEFWEYGVGLKPDAPADAVIGHYTQMIWEDSIYIGCGKATCDTEFSSVLVCHYGPGGNIGLNDAEIFGRPYKI